MFCFQTAISVMDFIIQIVIIPLFYRVTFLPLKAWLLIVWASTFSSTVTTKEKKMRGPVRKRIGDDKKKTTSCKSKTSRSVIEEFKVGTVIQQNRS